MAKQNNIQEEVEKTLRSFDDDGVLEENPFLLTRLLAEKESRLHRRHLGDAVRVNLKYVAIFLLFLMNLATAVYYYKGNEKDSLRDKLVSELRADYQTEQSQDDF